MLFIAVSGPPERRAEVVATLRAADYIDTSRTDSHGWPADGEAWVTVHGEDANFVAAVVEPFDYRLRAHGFYVPVTPITEGS